MKATITSTDAIVDVGAIRSTKARVWEGVTESGVPFTAYIMLVQVAADADNSMFERELTQHKPPSQETQRAIDVRRLVL